MSIEAHPVVSRRAKPPALASFTVTNLKAKRVLDMVLHLYPEGRGYSGASGYLEINS